MIFLSLSKNLKVILIKLVLFQKAEVRLSESRGERTFKNVGWKQGLFILRATHLAIILFLKWALYAESSVYIDTSFISALSPQHSYLCL